jgi:hypothetical protein
MNFHCRLGAMLVAGPLLFGGSAFADVIDLTTGGGGSIQIKFNNFESFGDLGPGGALQVGSTNFGVFEVTSIGQNGLSLYSAPTASSSDDYIIGVFNGITVASISGSASNINTGNSGGAFDFYEVSKAELTSHGFNANNIYASIFAQGTGGYAAAGGGCTTNSLCYNGITNVGATNYLDFTLVPGADAAGDTLSASLSTTIVPTTGSAGGYGDIIGGAAAPQFLRGTLTTALGTKADVHFADEFCPNGSGGQCTPGVGNWEQESYDPANATITAPEPGSVPLLGSALLALGFVGYLRRSKRPSA